MNEITLSKENPIIASEENMAVAVAAGLIAELLEIVEDFDSEICDLWMKKKVISYDERIELSTFYIEQCLKSMIEGNFSHAEFLSDHAMKEFVTIDVMEGMWEPYISEDLRNKILAFSEKVSA